MQCTRCAGMRVPEIISEGGLRIMALRCVHCGDIVDRVIAHNRERRRHSYPRRPRTPTYESDVPRLDRLARM
jgi:ferredoxin-like protein FixX